MNLFKLFKRVEKHFTEASGVSTGESNRIIFGTMLVGAWRVYMCEEELLRITEFFCQAHNAGIVSHAEHWSAEARSPAGVYTRDGIVRNVELDSREGSHVRGVF